MFIFLRILVQNEIPLDHLLKNHIDCLYSLFSLSQREDSLLVLYLKVIQDQLLVYEHMHRDNRMGDLVLGQIEEFTRKSR